MRWRRARYVNGVQRMVSPSFPALVSTGCSDHGEILDWLHRLRGPVRVAYEAGPTGFGLARALTDAQIDCVVAAPSKLIRPAGDRVKTDARDAAHLTRLLRLGEITAVSVPDADVEVAGSR
ncbi:MAG: transposase [Mycobacterium sp.]|nr:transposase [Mycobacterium sp.]